MSAGTTKSLTSDLCSPTAAALRAAIVAEAEAWMGTPWVHQQAVREVGCDCVGLVVGVARACGLAIADCSLWRGYHKQPDGRTLVAHLGRNFERVAEAGALPGDVMLFRIGAAPQHLAILGPGEIMIHAYAPARRVVAHRLDTDWRGRLLSVWRFRELVQRSDIRDQRTDGTHPGDPSSDLCPMISAL